MYDASSCGVEPEAIELCTIHSAVDGTICMWYCIHSQQTSYSLLYIPVCEQ